MRVYFFRNASLQLYGAVIPRLVGQCSGKKGKTPDFGDGYSFNHFVTHYPTLAGHVLAELQAVSRIRGTSSEALRSYANVAYMLVLLSKMHTDACDLVDYPSQMFAETFELLVREFLGKPMIYVRQLAAKAYAALTSAAKIDSRLNATRRDAFLSCDDNLSHGLLLTKDYLNEKACNNERYLLCDVTKDYATFDSYAHLLQRYNYVCKTWQSIHKRKEVYIWPCYILETLFFQEWKTTTHHVFPGDMLVSNNTLSMIDDVASSQKIRPGFFQFLELYMRLYASRVGVDFALDDIRHILDSNCVELSVGFLNGLKPNSFSDITILKFILKYLISMNDNRHQLFINAITTFVLETLKHMTARPRIVDQELSEIVQKFNNIKTTVMANSNVTRLRNTLILAFSEDGKEISKVLRHILYANVDDEFTKMTVIKYIEVAITRYSQLKDDNRLTTLQCCLNLLKDEIAETRNVVSILLQEHVIKYCRHDTSIIQYHEEIVFQSALEDILRGLAFYSKDFNFDCAHFIKHFTRASKISVDLDATIKNPFCHDTIFYREETRFLDLYFLYANFRRTGDSLQDLIEARKILQKNAGVDYDDLQAILYLKETDYLMRKQDVVMEYNVINYK